MNVWLYRGSLSARSGAGQLMLAQARGLADAGARARVVSERGTLRFWLRTGHRPRRMRCADVGALAADGTNVVVDHGLELAAPSIAFVHNLYSEALAFVDRDDWRAPAAQEEQYFERLDARVPIVANSAAVKAALEARYAIAPERLDVIYPGFSTARFDPRRLPALRASARRRLGVDAGTPLVGFVTSGDFAKRGIDTFLATAERIADVADEVRFLVVGSRRLPEAVTGHPLFATGQALYRPRTARPELWLAALDVFLYAAHYEEFGLVVLESAALGVPVVTSRRVGAVECLPESYAPWLADTPEPDALADAVATLIGDAAERERLAGVGARHVRHFDSAGYAARSTAAILAARRT